MEKVNRWIAKHVWLVYVAAVALWILTICGLANDQNGAVLLILYLLTIAWILLCAQWIFTRGNVLLKKPLEILQNECDPYPFLKEVKEQKNYPGNWNVKLGHVINESAALREVGEFEQAYNLLTSIQEEVVLRAAPAAQALYFSEMLYFCIKLQDFTEMEFWHKKLLDARNRTKMKKHKQMVDGLIVSFDVLYYHARQEYERSLQALQAIPQESLRARVVVAMNYARYFLATGEKDAAKEKLEFVVSNGNKLYIVTEAKTLLAKLNTEE